MISKYKGTCSFCRKEYQPGEKIYKINNLSLHYNLGLTSKVFKYAHVTCQPIILPEKYIEPIKEATKLLLSLTDPMWRKDDTGFNRADYSPAQKWLAQDCPVEGAHNIAKRLAKYADTQLGGKDQGFNPLIKEAAEYGQNSPISVNSGCGDGKRSPNSGGVVESPIKGAVVREKKLRNEIHILVGKSGKAHIFIDPPWENEDHKIVKDLLKTKKSWWEKDEKCWSLDFSTLASNWNYFFEGRKVSLTEEAVNLILGALERKKLSNASSVNNSELDQKLKNALPQSLKLYPFQKAGVAFLEAAGGKALLGDEMGLGKTVQAIAYCALHQNENVLCIVPAVVSVNWEKEIQKWLPEKNVNRIKNGKSEINENGINIITYDLMRRRWEEFKDLNIGIVIMDESHYLKNIKAKRTKAVLELIKNLNPKSVIALSGTPIVNRPVEFYTTLKMLRPKNFGSWWQYTTRYCNGHRDKWGYQCSGASNTEELSEKLRDLMVRRKKSEVLTELPEKTRIISEVELPSTYRRKYRTAIREKEVLAAITTGRQILGEGKSEAAIKWIQEYVDQETPVVVVVHHQNVIDLIKEGLNKLKIKCGVINQAVSQENRSKAVDNFQNGKIDVILIAAKSGGVGITLTRASNVLFVERQWTPGDEEQAEDRCHRIGQKDSVTVRYLVVPNTIDEMMSDLIEEKRIVLHKILDGEKVEDDKLDIRNELIMRINKEKK